MTGNVFNKVMAVIGIAATIIAICAVLIVVVLRGGPQALSLPAVLSLLGFIGTLIGLITVLINVNATRTMMNGHLTQHMKNPPIQSGKVKIEATGTISSPVDTTTDSEVTPKS